MRRRASAAPATDPGLSSVGIGEPALHILRRAGFTDTRAVAAFSGIIALNYG